MISASDKGTQCQALKTEEIEAANELTEQLVMASEALYKIAGRSTPAILDSEAFGSYPGFDIKILKSRDFTSFWSFIYDRTLYADWKSVPRSGYRKEGDFAFVGNFIVISPNSVITPDESTIRYASAIAYLTKVHGFDGISQLLVHSPDVLEEMLTQYAFNGD
ncbi:MAG: hypothetical protein R3E64_17630 [Halioglobus sp.]